MKHNTIVNFSFAVIKSITVKKTAADLNEWMDGLGEGVDWRFLEKTKGHGGLKRSIAPLLHKMNESLLGLIVGFGSQVPYQK